MAIFQAIVILTTIGFFILFLSPGFQLGSLRNVLVVVWFYYGFCVPIDRIMGVPLFESTSIDFINLNLPESEKFIFYIFGYYWIFLFSFIFSYQILGRKIPETAASYNFEKLLPSVFTVIVFNMAIAGLNILVFGGLGRGDRTLLINESFIFKLAFLTTTLTFGLNSIYILYKKNFRDALLVTIVGCLSIFQTGGRTTAIYFILLFIMSHRIQVNWKVKLMSIPILAIFVFFFKGLFNNLLNIIASRPLTPFIAANYDFGLSRFEGIMSFSIFSTLLDQFSFKSPFYFGKTYLESLYFLFLRESFVKKPLTLSESFLSLWGPEVSRMGGGIAFSGLAEAWLNFGTLGAVISGLVVGIVVRYFDRNRWHYFLPIILLIVLRYFRSDFSSIFKRLIVMNGGVLVLILGFLYLYRSFLFSLFRSIRRRNLSVSAKISCQQKKTE